MRIGQGWDAHRLVEGRALWLGGVQIPHDRGLAGHSDGDVLLHAVASALLGAVGAGDLGSHFPSTDPAFEGVASGELLSRVLGVVASEGFAIGNLDTTVVAQEPRLGGQREAMRDSLASLLEVPPSRVSVKITSSDGLGAIGRGEGIAAQAVVLLVPA